MKIPSALVYIGVSLLLILWWGLAFSPEGASKNVTNLRHLHQEESFSEETQLSAFKRSDIQEALIGNSSLMAALIADWDVDAQYLIKKQIPGIKRLPEETLLQLQLLARGLAHPAARASKGRYLPQTYAAASFLLALTKPEEIVALPGGFRQQTTLFPSALTSAIPLDIDRHHSEALFLSQPDLAFVAPYSHPSTVEALRNQGIPLFCISSLDTVEDICRVLLEIGDTIRQPAKATLLKGFIESALFAIDNRAAYEKSKRPLPKTLYVSYRSTFSLPTKKSLVGQLLVRLGVMGQMDELKLYHAQHLWSVPVDQEKIVNFKPDCLIISTESVQGLQKRIGNDPAFQGLRNACGRIAYINEDIVSSPTQHVVLAYYDLLQAMTSP